MDIPRKKERLRFFQDLYERAKNYSKVDLDALDRHYKQYKGDKAIDGSNEEAEVVRNITYELIESQITSYLPTVKVNGSGVSDERERLAKSIEALANKVKDEQPFERLNDLDERYTYVYGASIWVAEWDESITTHSTVGGVRVDCISPRHFVGQPGINAIEDMEYLFISYETTKEDLVRRYGVSWEKAQEAQSEENAEDETATLVVCYYKNEDERISKYVWSDEVELEDQDDYYSRKREYCTVCGERRQLCQCDNPKFEVRNEEMETLTRAIKTTYGVIEPECVKIENGVEGTREEKVPLTDAEGNQVMEMLPNGLTLPKLQTIKVPVMEKTELPFYTPKRFPVVVRINTSREASLFGQSDCEFIRPQQQAINKVETRIMQKLMRAGITPVVPDKCDIALNNSVFGQVIKLQPGQSASDYGRIDTTPDISKDIAEAERLYDQAKRQMGISDSFQGQADTTAKSGIAKQAQINQSAGRLDSKRRMKNAAYADLFQIIFELYLAYADEPRPGAYMDQYGRMQEIEFNRYDFFKRDAAGKWYIDDTYLFSADTSADVAYSREALWEINMSNFKEGAYGDPASPETQLTYWLNMERAHYPYAHDNVERLKGIVDMQRMIQEQQAIIQNQQAIIQNQQATLAEYKNAVEREKGEKDQLMKLSRKQGEIMKSEREAIEKLRGGNK